MAIQNANVSLRAHFPDGSSVSREALRPLAIDSEPVDEVIVDRGPWQSALVVFAQRQSTDYEAEEDPQGRMAEVLSQDMQRMGAWLAQQSEALAALRSIGLEVDVFVDMWIDQDQMDWSFPDSFLRACGEAGLSVRMVTND